MFYCAFVSVIAGCWKLQTAKGSFSRCQRNTELMQRHGSSHCNGQGIAMLFGKTAQFPGNLGETGTVCDSQVIARVAKGVQRDSCIYEKISNMMLWKGKISIRFYINRCIFSRAGLCGMHCIGICPYQDQPLVGFRIDLKFSETFQKVFRVRCIAVEQGTYDKMLLICLMLAVLAQFPAPGSEGW